ncbi:hypothetical protein [Actinoplanes sp. NPDC048796]|uniref:hypothetical protein n=1 Tax=Actinoplanes sp. NPDC048796 TaxID=3155640 RepID=UPI0033D202A8
MNPRNDDDSDKDHWLAIDRVPHRQAKALMIPFARHLTGGLSSAAGRSARPGCFGLLVAAAADVAVYGVLARKP